MASVGSEPPWGHMLKRQLLCPSLCPQPNGTALFSVHTINYGLARGWEPWDPWAWPSMACLLHRYSPPSPSMLAMSALLGHGLDQLKAALEAEVLKATGRQVVTLRIRLCGTQLEDGQMWPGQKCRTRKAAHIGRNSCSTEH